MVTRDTTRVTYGGKNAWLLFLIAEAGPKGADRIRVWRALKALGAAVVRDGVYLLPQRAEIERELRDQQREVRRANGQAHLFVIPRADEDDELHALFDRSSEFAAITEAARAFVAEELPRAGETETRRALRALQRDFASLVATDYFPAQAHANARAAVAAADAAFVERFSPGEPHAAEHDIAPLDRAAHQGRLWATRRRLWVDRVASAWLIRRFVDPQATFAWLDDVRDCPPNALSFDFDGATFTHVGAAVTFEVLLQSFALAGDPGLERLGKMVRSLDVAGSLRTPEAAGFEALLTGAREQCKNDDELLDALSRPLDFLHEAFRCAASGEADPDSSTTIGASP